jgi:hypothetical protein
VDTKGRSQWLQRWIVISQSSIHESSLTSNDQICLLLSVTPLLGDSELFVLGVPGGASAAVMSVCVSDPGALGVSTEAPTSELSSGLLGAAGVPISLSAVVEQAANITKAEGELCVIGSQSGLRCCYRSRVRSG